MINSISLDKISTLHIGQNMQPENKSSQEAPAASKSHFQSVYYTTSSGDLFIGYLLSLKG